MSLIFGLVFFKANFMIIALVIGIVGLCVGLIEWFGDLSDNIPHPDPNVGDE